MAFLTSIDTISPNVINNNISLYMILRGQAMNWYNSFPQHSLYNFEQLKKNILDQFSINVKKWASIIDSTKLSQYDQESITDYLARWRNLITNINFLLPQEDW